MAINRGLIATIALVVCLPALVSYLGQLAIFKSQSPTFNTQTLGHTEPLSFEALLAQSKQHTYKSEILSRDPLMIYVDNFLHPLEIPYLLNLSETRFAPSHVHQKQGDAQASTRTSRSCYLPVDDPLVENIQNRALDFLGFIENDGLESLQLVRYDSKETYALHYDWFSEPTTDRFGRLYNRLASFFVYIEADCTEGETYFPQIALPEFAKNRTDRFSTPKGDDGIGFVPRKGSGVFWMNLMEDGEGDEMTVHAGLPVGEGRKTGMNIWVKKVVKT